MHSNNCTDMIGVFLCNCDPGWTGQMCEAGRFNGTLTEDIICTISMNHGICDAVT